MIELLCISTHPQGAVIFGLTYPLMKDGDNDEHACKCNKGNYDVGIRHDDGMVFSLVNERSGHKLPIAEPPIGTLVKCAECQQPFIYGGRIWWINKKRFGLMSEQTEESSYEKHKELQLAE